MKIEKQDQQANQNIFIVQGKIELWNKVGFMTEIRMHNL